MFHDANGGAELCTELLSCLKQSSLDVVPDILSGPISYTCRRAHMQVEDPLDMTACLRIFKLPNFEVRGELREAIIRDKRVRDNESQLYFYFSQKTGLDTSCKLSPMETICMKCQILFSGRSKKNIINLSSADLAKRVVKVTL